MTGLRLLAAVGTFATSIALLFPTDLVVGHLIARTSRPGWPELGFAHARLRPRGIRLEDVTLRDADGVELARAAYAYLRPSLTGLVQDGRGLPWRIEADVCRGTGDATVSADGLATAITVAWRNADLGACPPLAVAVAGVLGGRARGTARFAFLPGMAPEGTGRVEIEAAAWRGMGLVAALGTLHAATASVRWRLRQGRLLLETLDIAGPEVTVEGSGALRLADPWGESDLDFRLALAPASGAPQFLRTLLGLPADGTRQVLLAGTLAQPRAVLQ